MKNAGEELVYRLRGYSTEEDKKRKVKGCFQYSANSPILATAKFMNFASLSGTHN